MCFWCVGDKYDPSTEWDVEDEVDRTEIDRVLRNMGVGGLEDFTAEARKWAKEAEQCKICQAWAKLDKNGHCLAHKDK